MSIKQYGGVFGRNPTFNKIDSDGNANLGDGTLFVDSVNKRVGIDKTNPQYPLDFNLAATGMVARFGDDNVTSYVSFSNPRTFFGYHTGNTMVQSGAGKKIIFYTGSNTPGDAAAVAAKVLAGNLVIGTSGKGIDFSATAGTGTSELLDDYEEGTWTPVLTFATAGDVSVTYGQQTGTYVKIGKLVVLKCRVTTSAFSHSTASGALRITGLPFSATNRTLNPIAFNGITKANYTTISSQIDTGSSISTFIASGSGQSQGSVLASDVPTGGSPILQFVIAYEN